ncbi:YqgE/AlgH family protein [Parvularcula sp. IMCC14364]|uniref:YqgE/AlgH family protein n=1 Tax=Parvularcula sp. IMCC14364 TaxID=3067902 RepID=UPI00274036A4|nr:YqgE/AlgH family protein [Parvularcula sp. IMCC14364]
MIELNTRTPMPESLTGQLLLAMPNLKEGCFEQSVVLICSHDESHAMGLIVNKQITDMSFATLLAQLDMEADTLATDRKLHFGGPVETKRGLILHDLSHQSDETVHVTDEIGLTATRQMLEDLNEGRIGQDANSPALLCMGHAGWAPGQLEGELAQNAWLNIPATRDLVFNARPDKTWEHALAGMGVSKSMFSAEWSDTRHPDAPLN